MEATRTPEIRPDELRALQEAAERARDMHYAPYSDYLVLAAARTSSGDVFGGSNVEIANFTLTKHAEEAAILAALAAGQSPRTGWLSVLFVAGGPPCGSCRQFAHEFAADDAICVVQSVEQKTLRERRLTEIESPSIEVWRLDDLLPRAFGPEEVTGRLKAPDQG